MADEVIQVGIEPVGIDGVKALEASYRSLEARMEALNAKRRAGSIGEREYEEQWASLSGELLAAADALERATAAQQQQTAATQQATAATQQQATAQAQATANVGSQTARASSAALAYSRSLNTASGGAQAFNYRLMVAAQTLDDMQYVGEMGLRPILNNLVMIHPALGIVAIGFETVRKHGDELVSMGQSLMSWRPFDEATASTETFMQGMRKVGEETKDILGGMMVAAGEFGKQFNEMFTPSKAAQGDAAMKKFLNGPTEATKEQGQAVAKSIGELGTAEVLDELLAKKAELDPRIAERGSEARRAAAGDTVGMLEKAQKGDPEALKDLEREARGTNLASHIAANAPRTEEQKRQDKEAKDRLKEEQDAQDRHNEEIDKAREKAVESYAKDLQERFTSNAVSGGAMPTESDVAADLEKSGVAKERAAQMAGDVLDALRKTAIEAIESNARKKGITDAESMDDLAKTAEAKRQQAAEKAANEARADFKKADPNADKQIERRLMGGMLAGQESATHGQLVKELAEAMKAQGIGTDDATRAAAAENVVADQEAKVKAKIEEGVQDAKDTDRKAPELRGAMDLHRALLTAGGADDTQKKHLSVSEQMRDQLIEQGKTLAKLQTVAVWPGRR